MSSVSQRACEVEEGCIVGFGNVLLDIICPISDEFLCKYELEPDTTTLAKEKHFPLFDQVKGALGVRYCSGGSAANTLRVAQWILGSYKGTALVGSVGDDEESVKLLDLLEHNKVTLLCQKFPNAKTGKCAVLTHGVSRTLVTQLGASVLFDYTEFMQSSFDYVMTNSRVIYISGYFFRVCFQTIKKAVEIAVSKRIPIVFNLNAVWVVESFHKEIQELLPFVDFIIANSSEATALFEKLEKNDSNDINEIAKYISKRPKICKDKFRTVVITCGEEAVIVAQDDQVIQYPVIDIQKSNIVDTNGAGDAFAGGFLARLLEQKSVSECVKCGLWTASKVIQQIGCNFSQETQYSSDCF